MYEMISLKVKLVNLSEALGFVYKKKMILSQIYPDFIDRVW